MEPKLFAYLSYRDAPAALTWLAGLGFALVRRQDGDVDQVVHAEVRLGEVVLMISTADAAYETPALLGRSTGRGLYLLVDDVDTSFHRARAAGGTPVIEPEDTEWGTRRARVLDPEGNEWSFGTYEPGASW
ncbi:VOC family protein [Cryobacterium arcticum]|uniref:Glyoxalase n=1 Tax=Cryobacterium arcticum TaxID=670052 RepID=A0A1B1BEX7_9MICO|nr:VOC family protein [Cryobacterium arcticum]ANP71083.1 glyoxalase [Cryobacterium arcticum]